MTNNTITQEKLCTLRDGLRRGAQKEIAEEMGVTQAWVCRVLNGDAIDDRVIKIALQKYFYYKRIKQRNAAKFNQL